MPNFITNNLERPSLPFSEDGYDFLWEVRCGNSFLVMVRSDKSAFFISINFVSARRDGSFYLVKGEKISRPHQVLYLQNALEIYARKAKCVMLFSNTKPAHNRREVENYVVNIADFFLQKHLLNCDKIYVDIGFGSGRYLLHQAQNNPDTFFIGVEIHKPSLEQVAKRCEIYRLKNVILIDGDSRILVEFLPSNCVDKIFVHFPVPWGTKPHRRVISRYFMDDVLRVLKVGGTLELRTDSEPYFNYAFDIFTNMPDTNTKVLKNFELEVVSKYEDKWKKSGKDIYDIILQNHKESEECEQLEELKFDFCPSVSKIISKFSPKLFRGSNFFVHFETLHKKDNNTAIIKIAFGANERPERSFIILKNNEVSYFPKCIYGTKTNKMVHEIIKKWLHE